MLDPNATYENAIAAAYHLAQTEWDIKAAVNLLKAAFEDETVRDIAESHHDITDSVINARGIGACHITATKLTLLKRALGK